MLLFCEIFSYALLVYVGWGWGRGWRTSSWCAWGGDGVLTHHHRHRRCRHDSSLSTPTPVRYSAVEMWTLQERKRLCLPIPLDYKTAYGANDMNMVPTVDILLPSCGEPTDIIQDTVRAALAQDYPKDRFQVYVCDDKASDELRDW